jgi:hypothetical protein
LQVALDCEAAYIISFLKSCVIPGSPGQAGGDIECMDNYKSILASVRAVKNDADFIKHSEVFIISKDDLLDSEDENEDSDEDD